MLLLVEKSPNVQKKTKKNLRLLVISSRSAWFTSAQAAFLVGGRGQSATLLRIAAGPFGDACQLVQGVALGRREGVR